MEQELTTQQLIGNLVKVGHKQLMPYVQDGMKVLGKDPDLFAHLIAWNQIHGEIRDSKVAYPVIALRGEPGDEKIFHENAVSHLLLLDPRNFVKALDFHKEIGKMHKVNGAGSLLKYGIEQYLKAREENKAWWDRTVLQHRKSVKTLYALNHIKPSRRAQSVLFDRKYPKDSVFEAIRNLKIMSPQEASGTILHFKIPFMIAIGSIGGLKKNTDLALALIENMSPAELITNSNMLQNLGIMEVPALKSAYEAGLSKAKTDKKVSSLKAGRAASVITDEKVKAKLEKIQETKIDSMKGLEGDWLVLGDMSGSMHLAVEKAKELAAVIARFVKGKVYLVFFNTSPRFYEVSGKSLEEIKKMTSGIRANGGTSIGCGLKLIADKNIIVNGIAICSDGGENQYPEFREVYNAYSQKQGISPTVYLLHLPGEGDVLTSRCKGISYEKLDVSKVDYYAMPNLIKLLKTSRYTLISDIMDTPLLTIQEVLKEVEKPFKKF
jgi:hypothetical protein